MSGQTLNILFKSLFSLVYKSPETKNCLVFVTLEWAFYIYRWVEGRDVQLIAVCTPSATFDASKSYMLDV